MDSILEGVDLTDPCAVWPKLYEALLKLEAGESVIRVRIGTDDVTLSEANRPALERRVEKLKAECEAKNRGRSLRRRALTAGFR